MVEPPYVNLFAVSLPRSSTSSSMHSVMQPVSRAAATLAANSLPRLVAPIRSISGSTALAASKTAARYGSTENSERPGSSTTINLSAPYSTYSSAPTIPDPNARAASSASILTASSLPMPRSCSSSSLSSEKTITVFPAILKPPESLQTVWPRPASPLPPRPSQLL